METYLSHLISMRTVTSDVAANDQALDYVQDFLAGHGLYVARYNFDGQGALVATTRKDSKTPRVLLAAHMDVVPGPDSVFALRQENGKYFGRGVFDMQFAIACYMQVMKNLGDTLGNYDLGIMITTDEEIGGLNGTAKLVEMGYKPDVCILPDGANDWQIETLAKGFIHGTIETSGKTSHGSMPWEGDSATFHLIDLLHELKQYFDGQTLDTNTINIGMLTGGNAINQTPAHASATVDIRYISESDHTAILNRIHELCHAHNAIFVEEPLESQVSINKLDHPLIKPFTESILTVTGIETSGTISHGSSDARFFARVGVPSIICRPPGGGQHADNEWIEIKGCMQYIDVLVDYITRIALVP